MTVDEKLAQAIEQLYSAFERYPLRDRMESCPCCDGGASSRPLHTKRLRRLTGEDLRLFAFRSMTTAGDVDDFRHFLPRILEILPDDFPVDKEVVLGKLTYGRWGEWPSNERKAVRDYIRALWVWALRRQPEEDNFTSAQIGSYLCAIARADPDLSYYLAAWDSDGSLAAQANLAGFLDDYAERLFGSAPPFAYWEDAALGWRQVQEWARRVGRSRVP